MTQHSRFPRLFEPAHIGQMALRNRIVMPPMGTGLATVTGEVTQPMQDYYAARAKGGASLIIAEGAYVDAPRGMMVLKELCIDDDKFLPGLGRLAQAIQKYGARAAIQLHHAGIKARSALTGVPPAGPSATARPGFELPHELSRTEIADIVELYARAGERLRRAGFDGVEIQAGGGYLLSAFLSAAYNTREDEYGGTPRNRARFLCEVITAIKSRAGRDYPVWCRIYGREYQIEHGISMEEGREIARLAEAAGADAIHVIAGNKLINHATLWPVGKDTVPPAAHPPGYLLPLAAEIKKAVRVPVIGVGRITLDIAETSLEKGIIDLVAIGRALIADPDLPEKARQGKLDDIIPCIGCLVCRDQPLTDAGTRCSVNPTTGKERRTVSKPAPNPRKVTVIGGGPAGLQAALTAARRGHQVILYEAAERLGGQLRLACLPPYKEAIQDFTDYLVLQTEKLQVEVRLGVRVSPEQVFADRPEVVILAAGSVPSLPDIPGINGADVIPAGDVLTGKHEAGRRVAVIGGGLVGCETAEFLADQGHQVTIIEALPEIAIGVGPSTRPLLLEKLSDKGIVTYSGTSCERINREGITACDAAGKRKILRADSIVLATGSVADDNLYAVLRGKVGEIHLVGDCRKPGCIADAVADGARIGRII